MKKQSIAVLLLVGVLLPTLLFTSCAEQKNKYTAHSLDYFDTATTITGYETSQDQFDQVSKEILDELEQYHRLFTIYERFDGVNNLCVVNSLQDGVHPTVTVDRCVIDLLLYAQEMYRVTDGKMNIAMGGVLSLWHEYRTAGLDKPEAATLPPMDLLREAAKHTNIDALQIDEEHSTVWISDPQTTLDVGAIGKGYAVEMVARSLEGRGIAGYVINVGGNVRTVGTKPEGEHWIAGIEHPNDDEQSYVACLRLAGESLVTSGSYQRYYTVGDKTYHHIIDPQTLMPAEGYLSVSVVCKDSVMADALSTALFCMSQDEGYALVESLSDTEALWIMPDKTRHYSSGFEAYVTDLT